MVLSPTSQENLEVSISTVTSPTHYLQKPNDYEAATAEMAIGSSVPSPSSRLQIFHTISMPGSTGPAGVCGTGIDGGATVRFSPTQSMEIVWHGEFDKLFAQYYPTQWYLIPTFELPAEGAWRSFKDSAKVRFQCSGCGHGWTSMKGRVIFWYQLQNHNVGYVMFKLYGQQCIKCNNGKFEHAMWYPEEVIKVIGNVYNRIGQMYFGFHKPPLRIDRRAGKPRNQHNSELCQACKEGLCREEWAFS